MEQGLSKFLARIKFSFQEFGALLSLPQVSVCCEYKQYMVDGKQYFDWDQCVNQELQTLDISCNPNLLLSLKDM